MQKIKSLLPSLKEKKRYIVIRVTSTDENNRIQPRNPMAEMVDKINGLMGMADSANSGIIPVDYDLERQLAILRINNRYADKLKACLPFIEELGGQQVILSSAGASGILAKARSKFAI